MKKALKISLKVLAGLFALFVVLMIVGYFALIHWVNPNEFKPQIVAMVKQDTGRDFIIQGDLSWDFFPNIGIHMGAAALSNPAGFAQTTFAQVGSADLSLSWSALLRRHISVSQITLNGLQVYLISDKNKNNWTFSSASTSATTTENSNAALSLILDGIAIHNGTITYDDLQAKTHYAVNNLELETPNFSLIAPMEVKAAGDLSSDDLSGIFNIDTLFSYDDAKSILTLNNTALSTHFTYVTDDNQNIPIVLSASGNILADLNNQIVNLSDVSFSLNQNLMGTVNVKLSNFNQLNYTGNINISSFALNNMLNSFGKSLPNSIPNKDQFSKMSLQSNFSGNLNSIAFSNMNLGLGNTTVRGNMAITSFASFAMNADLTANQIDVADFINLKGSRLPMQNIAVKGNISAPKNNFDHFHYNANTSIGHFSLLDLINVSLPKMPNKNQFANMNFQGNVEGDLDRTSLKNFTLGLDKTIIRGNVDIRSFNPVVIREDLIVNQLDLANFVNLKGAALPMQNIAMNGNTSFDNDNMFATLNGTQNITIQDVVLKGFDLSALLNQVDVIVNNILDLKKVSDAYSTIQSQLSTFENSQGPINANNGKQTDFGSVKAQIVAQNGILTTPVMLVSGPLVVVGGQGKIDLNQQTMDYHLNAKVLASSRNIIKTLNIPYNISGSFANLQQGVDMASITQQMVQFVLIQIGKTVTSVVKTVISTPVDVVSGVSKGAADTVGGVAKGVAGALNSIFGGSQQPNAGKGQ